MAPSCLPVGRVVTEIECPRCVDSPFGESLAVRFVFRGTEKLVAKYAVMLCADLSTRTNWEGVQNALVLVPGAAKKDGLEFEVTYWDSEKGRWVCLQ
jgi:hypothetical protein